MHLTTRTGSHLALRLGWKKQKHGVPNFMEGSLISYEIGDPGVTKILENWGPGPPISYENGDLGPQFHMKMGTRGPHFGRSPFSLDTRRRSGTWKPVNVFYSGSHSKQRLSRICGHHTHNLLVLRSPQFSFTVGPQSLYGHKSVLVICMFLAYKWKVGNIISVKALVRRLPVLQTIWLFGNIIAAFIFPRKFYRWV